MSLQRVTSPCPAKLGALRMQDQELSHPVFCSEVPQTLSWWPGAAAEGTRLINTPSTSKPQIGEEHESSPRVGTGQGLRVAGDSCPPQAAQSTGGQEKHGASIYLLLIFSTNLQGHGKLKKKKKKEVRIKNPALPRPTLRGLCTEPPTYKIIYKEKTIQEYLHL